MDDYETLFRMVVALAVRSGMSPEEFVLRVNGTLQEDEFATKCQEILGGMSLQMLEQEMKDLPKP